MNDISICSDKKYSISEITLIVQGIFEEYRKRCKDIHSYKERQAVKNKLKWKKIKDEVLPIIKVAEYYKADYLSFSLNSRQYDGIIYVNNQKHYIECTTAIDYRQNDLVYQIFDSEENDGVLIPYNYSNKKLEESVGYISKNHRIQKQVEPNLEMSVLDRNKPISNIRKQILQKVTKAHKNGCYRGYILILTISSPEFYCNKNLLEDFWKNQISNNPFCNLFIIETQNNFDDFQLVMKI